MIAAPPDLAKRLIQRHSALETKRAAFKSHWDQIAVYVAPDKVDATPGQAKRLRAYSGAMKDASGLLINTLFTLMMNPAARWFDLSGPAGVSMTSDQLQWLDDAANAAFQAFSDPDGNFYGAAFEMLSDMVVFGTGVMLSSEASDLSAMLFQSVPVASATLGLADNGSVDTLMRREHLPARVAVAKFGEDAPTAARRAVERNQPDELIEFLHVIAPTGDLGLDLARPYAGVWIGISNSVVCAVEPYFDLPFFVARFERRSGTPYGMGPGMAALVDMDALSAVVRDVRLAAQKSVKPPLTAVEEAGDGDIDLSAGAVNWVRGDLMRHGSPIAPIQTSLDMTAALEVMRDLRASVREHFMYSQLVLPNRTNQTATEIVERRRRQAQALGGMLALFQTDVLGRLIRRMIGALLRSRSLAPPPGLVTLNVDYKDRLLRDDRLAQAEGALRVAEVVAQLMSIAPEIGDRVDLSKLAQVIVEGFGAPAAMLRSDEEAAALAQARQQQQQQMMAAQQAQMLAGAARDGAGAARDLAQAQGGGQADAPLV